MGVKPLTAFQSAVSLSVKFQEESLLIQRQSEEVTAVLTETQLVHHRQQTPVSFPFCNLVLQKAHLHDGTSHGPHF